MRRELCDTISSLPSIEQQLIANLVELLATREAQLPAGAPDEPTEPNTDESTGAGSASEALGNR